MEYHTTRLVDKWQPYVGGLVEDHGSKKTEWLTRMSGKPKQIRMNLDGGLGWLVVLSSFLQQGIVMGTHNVFGLLYIDLLEEFKQSKAATAWVASISFSLTFMVGPLSTALCTKFGVRIVSVIGAILFSLGLFFTSYVEDLYRMYVTYSILVAVGASFCYYESILVLNEYFSKRLFAANGIALSGAGIGTIALAPFVGFLLEKYHWRNTLRILSGTSLLLVPCSVILYLVPAPAKTIERPKFIERKKLLDWSVFKNKAFIVWTAVVSLVLFGFYIPYVHLVRHSQDLNIPRQEGGILVGYMAVSQTLGKIVFGRISDNPKVNRVYMYQVCLSICGVMTTLLPLFTTHASLVAYCWVFGFFDGCFVVLIAVLTGDVVGRENMSSAFGLMYFFSSVPMMFGPPVAGWMYEVTQTYVPAFYMAGACTILGVCLLFLMPLLLPQHVREEWVLRNGQLEPKNSSTGSSTPVSSEATKTWSIEESESSGILINVKSPLSPTTRSGSQQVDQRTLDKISESNGFDYILERYFSMPHLVTYKESLLSRVYSKENFLCSNLPETPDRETDV